MIQEVAFTDNAEINSSKKLFGLVWVGFIVGFCGFFRGVVAVYKSFKRQFYSRALFSLLGDYSSFSFWSVQVRAQNLLLLSLTHNILAA